MSTLVKNTVAYPSIFDSFFGKEILRDTHLPAYNGNAVAVNILQSANGYKIEIAAPGLTKSDFKLNLENDKLTISGHKEEQTQSEGQRFLRKEFKYSSFQRTFTLPNTVDSEKIEANYEAGVLAVSIPVREEAKPKPAREITIA
jgi:HSP20 family protein